MYEWEFVAYESLAAPEKSAFSMGPFGSKLTQRDYRNSGVPLTRGINLAKGIFHDSDFVYISPEKANEVIPANVRPGDLIFTHRGTIGQVSMIPRSPRFEKYVICSSQVKTRLDESRALPEFYYYWFRSPRGQRSILENSSIVGVPGIATPLTSIRKLQVPLPPLVTQRAVAAILGAFDDKIAVNDRIAATYEDIMSLRFANLAIDVDPSPEEEITASDLVEFNPRYRTTGGDDAVYLDMAALSTRSARVNQWTRRPPKSGTRFSNGDTVMARITPCLENGKTAYIDFLESNEIGIGSTEFIVMRTRENFPSHLSYCLARSPRFRDHAIRNMVGSSGRQRVAAASLTEFPLSRPRQPELAKFGEFTSKSFEHIKSLDAESQRLRELRDALLPKLMSGQVRIRDAENVVEDAV